MPDEVHHYHHTDAAPVTIDLKVAHTTRGDTWEIEVKSALTPETAVLIFTSTRDKLTPHLAPETKETPK
jgi:hypothetical protein